jgi:molybdopterin synthase sulfur carrier subunit
MAGDLLTDNESLDRTKVSWYIDSMNVEIRLYATFRDFLPQGSSTFSMTRSLDKEMTIAEMVKELGLPEDIPKIVIVNGSHAEFDYVLKDGDILSVFPPLAGG